MSFTHHIVFMLQTSNSAANVEKCVITFISDQTYYFCLTNNKIDSTYYRLTLKEGPTFE